MLEYQKSRSRRTVLGPEPVFLLRRRNTNTGAARRVVCRAGDFWYPSMSPHGTPLAEPAQTFHASRMAVHRKGPLT